MPQTTPQTANYPCPACRREHQPHTHNCPITTCHYCGQPLKDEWPSGYSRAGQMICPWCAERLPPCSLCLGTGLTLTGDLSTVVTHDPCSECHGDGFLKPGGGCAYSGYRFCDDPSCADCAERARIDAENRTEQLAKQGEMERRIDFENARSWGLR